jgi:tRNA pseudouridine55 synthase
VSPGGQERSDSGINTGGQERSDRGMSTGGQERSDRGMSTAGLVVVDKPAGMTSHDVVGRCRRLFGTRKVGHAGTLDPMATGVLVVGIERATKILGLLTATDKSYAATIRLGQTTSTEDAEGELLQTVPAENVTDAAVDQAVAGLRGDIDQVPSAVSAIKVDGQRAYKLVREGKSVELAARRVRIDRFEVLATRRHPEVPAGLVDVDVEVDCSSGTYIRALARDVGAVLGVGGHLVALRRTRVGRFALDEAHTLDRLADQPRLSYSLDEACLLAFPRRDLTAEEAESARHGRALPPAGIDGVYAAVAPDDQVIALLIDETSRTKSVVVVRPATL